MGTWKGPQPPFQTPVQRVIGAAQPLFTEEGPQFYKAAMAHNAQYAVPSPTQGGRPYQTPLKPADELAFRSWVSKNNIPFDPNAKIADYDMRGFWLEQQKAPQSQGRAANGHFPDTYKTPYDTTFSGESKYATKDNPFVWQGNNLVDTRSGQLVFKG